MAFAFISCSNAQGLRVINPVTNRTFQNTDLAGIYLQDSLNLDSNSIVLSNLVDIEINTRRTADGIDVNNAFLSQFYSEYIDTLVLDTSSYQYISLKDTFIFDLNKTNNYKYIYIYMSSFGIDSLETPCQINFNDSLNVGFNFIGVDSINQVPYEGFNIVTNLSFNNPLRLKIPSVQYSNFITNCYGISNNKNLLCFPKYLFVILSNE